MTKNFEIIERVGISTKSVSDAIDSAVKEANTEKPVAWFEVNETRGRVNSEGNLEFQVSIKIGRKI